MASAVTIQGPVVFFDGTCGLCNHWVQWIVRKDKQQIFRLAPLQGETAKKLVPPSLTTKVDTVVLWSDGKTWERSEAVWRILAILGGGSAVTAELLRWIPRFVRNPAYDIIAKYRKTFFGTTTCPLPDGTRFLP